MNVQETFLNTRRQDFKEADQDLKSQGWKERKALRSATTEIERAFIIYLLKQMAQGKYLGPQDLEELHKVAISRLNELYSTAPNGSKILQFKMYTREMPRNTSNINAEVLKEPEEFISDIEHQKMIQLNKNIESTYKDIQKAEKAAKQAEAEATTTAAKSRGNVAKVFGQIARNMRGVANISRDEMEKASGFYGQARFDEAKFHLNRAAQAAKYVINMKKEEKAMGLLANMMAKTNFGTQWQYTPGGIVERPEYREYSPELIEALSKMGMKYKEKRKGGRKTAKRK